MAYVNQIIFNSTHMISLAVPFFNSKELWMNDNEWKYLANEIDSKEINCSWWCFESFPWFLSWFLFPFLSFVLTYCRLFCWIMLGIWFVMTSWNDIQVLLVFEPAFLTRNKRQKLLRLLSAASELENEQSRHQLMLRCLLRALWNPIMFVNSCALFYFTQKQFN